MSPSSRIGRQHSVCISSAVVALLVLLFLPLTFALEHSPEQVDHGLLRPQTEFTTDSEVADVNITRRQVNDYTCAVGRPCKNGACCGSGGFCGYSPTYCGTGCSSNCNAKAECGQYSKVPGQKCPLNVCCSEHGFCGTTEEFCNSKCQSNCVLRPSPPSGGKGDGVLSKVIGYYESWNAFSSCRKTAPTDLPLSALTHVNYAFAYISPGSYQITTMDGRTPTSLFKETTNLKTLKPGLEVWVSVGGWTFSDNGTATQPLLGEIARDAGKRQIFANNLLKFLEEHAFDGFDLDWEYPGAPDRGGKEDDPDNFVKLMATIRATLNRSPRRLGISFTIPASYWYLRWFKVPELLQYADFTCLMSYDLHGLWDKENPIGNVINPHTNLTEIQRAVELLWRVNVPPSKIALGFGFYGRSFRLADPSCTTPGVCKFSGDPNKGACTDTSGYLSYYEIQDMIGGPGSVVKRRDLGDNITLETRQSGVQVKWDKTAAVKYISYQGNQWISFDDADTFKQKVDWANSIGFSGSLIWASDLDDNLVNAHSGLVGRSAASKPNNAVRAATKSALINKASANKGLAQACKKLFGTCVNVKSQRTLDATCRLEGMEFVGWDKMGCGKDLGTPICCEKDSLPNNCLWRGGNNNGFLGGLDCNGQCHEGEIQLFGSSNGGFPQSPNSNLKRCTRGIKSFCCTQNDFPELVKGCVWKSCLKSCSDLGNNMEEIANVWFNALDHCPSREPGINTIRRYCCPKSMHPFKTGSCKWKGSVWKDCADAKCSPNETTVAHHPSGPKNTGTCDWGRKKVLCCEMDSIGEGQLTCPRGMCAIDKAKFCTHDPRYDWSEDYDPADDKWPAYPGFSRRDAEDVLRLLESGEAPLAGRALEKRGGDRRTANRELVLNGIVILLELIFRAYAGPSSWTNGRNGRSASGLYFVPDDGNCQDFGVKVHLEDSAGLVGVVTEIDHVNELQYLTHMLMAFMTGTLYSGNRTTETGRLSVAAYRKYWLEDTDNLPRGKIIRPTPFTQRYFGNMNLLFGEVMGSLTTRDSFMGLESSMNRIKGALFAKNAPMSDDNFRRALSAAILRGDGEEQFLTPMRRVFQVFSYLFNAPVAQTLDRTRGRLEALVTSLSTQVPELAPLAAIWEDFDRDYFEEVAQWARTWLIQRMNEILAAITPIRNTVQARAIADELRRMTAALDRIRAPPRGKKKKDDDERVRRAAADRFPETARFPGSSGGSGGIGGG
ncbi:hypothetical protein QBC35DRAFT_453660 [Podospora australis]|uniref:chitinase n=1 Tax=Podospora australis TaxID=1536484 RepID=A0AAN6WTB4_9PEZI|nr:hypothetical protein QBC35DRAFT_453660 [Podospora australis]